MPSPSLPTINENDLPDVTKPRRRSLCLLSTKTADECLDWVVFPALLFIQFGATMFCQMKQGLLILDWKAVYATVLLFCVIAALYRQVLRRHPWGSLILLLLPEIFTNVLLGMVMFGSLLAAYEALVILLLILFGVGSIAAIHLYLHGRHVVSDDYQRLRNSDEVESDDDNDWIC